MAQAKPLELTDAVIERLATALADRAADVADRRLLVGIAGIPGAGKSTLAQRLLSVARAQGTSAALIAMDGYHLTNAALHERGLATRKGAPETFDAAGYIAALRHFQAMGTSGPVPIYDRAVHEPVIPDDPAHHIDRDTRLILTEGNYLLLDEPPWSALADVLDETWWLDTPIDVAQRWLMQRHRAVGRTEAEARARCAHDQRNAERILARRRTPDRVLR